MALGSIVLPDTNVGFDAQGTAMMPITAGTETVGTIKLKSPFEMFKETFTSMKESLLNMVNLQSKEQKEAAFVGPMQKPNDDLEGVETDTPLGNFVDKAENKGSEILEGIKEAFGNVSFGEKMTAILLTGGFLLFSKYKDKIVKALTPVVQFIMDLVDEFGPGKVFAGFIAGFVLLKSGLASKAIKGAGGLILKGIKASAAAIDKQGGLLKAMGNGFERINKGMGSLVNGAKKTGTFITTNLTKGFNKLGTGIEAMNKGVVKAGGAIKGGFTKVLGLIGKGFMMMKVGMTSMLSSLGPVLAPLLPVIAIAAGIAAIFFSLKSGFETFKQSLDDGDSMFTAVIKGLGDAILTLVTLPATLVKKLVGFIAGLFGFDNFKEKLESFSIKDAIVNTFKKLTGGMVNIIKAIAKGAAAALAAALPGGKTPQEEFARVYGEVMKGGEGESAALQGTTDFQGDQSQADFNKDSNEKVKGYDRMGEYDIGGDEGMGTGNATAISYYKKQAADQRYRDLGTGPFTSRDVRMGATGSDDFDGMTKQDMLEMFMEKDYITADTLRNSDFESKLTKKVVMKEGKVVSEDSKYIVVKGGNVTGDTINQMSETNITGELEVNNTEHTQKIIQEHF